jgi:hypothetical protein
MVFFPVGTMKMLKSNSATTTGMGFNNRDGENSLGEKFGIMTVELDLPLLEV